MLYDTHHEIDINDLLCSIKHVTPTCNREMDLKFKSFQGFDYGLMQLK